jgi:hypothetical protein
MAFWTITDHLPAHDKAAADSRWSIFGAEDGDRRSFRAHTNAWITGLAMMADHPLGLISYQGEVW